ncbi:longitudinals lacking protein, isoforms J/P/Q/S/Z-like [Cotesia glomerata]|uniref:longitudinals lacking protein, isoforms J/P/Q/S/Z-like n=1 Tax=Cotesia glomerata TaxID=32391 RepID=UPI001D01415E|nr:longitudinals lacking protein, isoforms J/P/Q/S/Z-like [Cotesia glomerata]
MVMIFNDLPGREETFPVKEEDDVKQPKIGSIKYACNNPKCNLTFKSERQHNKHSFDCLKNNLQPGEITFDRNAKLRDESKDNKEKIPSKNPVKPVKPKKTSKKIVHRYKIVDGRYSCCKCSRSYKYKQGLSLHMRTECGKEKKFICPFCENYRTYHKHSLRNHVNIIHGKEL